LKLTNKGTYTIDREQLNTVMAIVRKKNITFPAFRFLDRDGGLGLDTFIGTTCVADCG